VYSKHNVVVLDDGSVSREQLPSDGSDLSSGAESSSDDDDEDEEEEEEEFPEEGGELSDEEEQVDEGDDEAEFDDGDEERVNSGDEADTEGDGEEEEEEGENDGDLSEEEESRTDKEGTLPADLEPDENNKDDDDEENVVVVGKRRKALSERYDPQKARRRRLRGYYQQGNTFAVSTAVMMINLVQQLNKACTPDILWQAILGATDHFTRSRISEALYEELCAAINRELPDDNDRSKYTVGEGEDEIVVQGAEAGHIMSGLEYRFFMHRHWSLFESMYYSNYVASKLTVWKTLGRVKLQEMLARMGIPLQQSKQSYTFMTPSLRNHFRKQVLGDISEEYGLKNPRVVYKSFYRYNAFKNPIAASDVVHAITALLELGGDEFEDIYTNTNSSRALLGQENDVEGPDAESIDEGDVKSPSWVKCFNKAYDCLSMRPDTESTLKHGIALSLSLQKAIVGQGSAMLERHDSITRLKCFRYAFISRTAGGSIETTQSMTDRSTPSTSESIFGRPAVLSRLAHFLIDVQRENGAWSGRRSKPLVLAAEKEHTYVVVGISPIMHLGQETPDVTPTRFRQLFKLAADETNAKSRNDGFDTNVIEVDRADINAFIENLMFLMTT